QNGNWWIKFTISQHETMLSVGLMPYGDRIHDVIDYDVFRCDAQPITSAHPISASCTELMKQCNATIGQTSEQTCEGWGPRTVGPDFGLRIRSTGGMVDPFLPHGLPYLYEVYCSARQSGRGVQFGIGLRHRVLSAATASGRLRFPAVRFAEARACLVLRRAPSPPPLPSPPPPTFNVSSGFGSASVAWTGSASSTCIRGEFTGINVTALTLASTSGPSSLAWQFDIPWCIADGCTLTLCGFEVGTYTVEGELTADSFNEGLTNQAGRYHKDRKAPASLYLRRPPLRPLPPSSPPLSLPALPPRRHPSSPPFSRSLPANPYLPPPPSPPPP
ncbi:hypothetical protein CYMTET_36172, partial [Cymbomonas tetramitiformis]